MDEKVDRIVNVIMKEGRIRATKNKSFARREIADLHADITIKLYRSMQDAILAGTLLEETFET